MHSLSQNKENSYDLILKCDKTVLPAITPSLSINVKKTSNTPLMPSTDMINALAPLRNIPDIDKTELALLRSRIDEQSELITILKSRSDCAAEESKVLRGLNKEMMAFRDQAAETIERKLREYARLDERFDMLSVNHSQMIEIKDEYKIKNIELTQENNRLIRSNENLFSKKINEQKFEIDKLSKLLQKIENEKKEFFNKLSDTEIKLKVLESKYNEDIGNMADKLKATQSKSKDTINELEIEINILRNKKLDEVERIATLEKDKRELVSEIMSRGETIQKKQSDIITLQKELKNAYNKLKEERIIFDGLRDDFDANIQVKIWKGEVEKYEERIEEMNREFDAFRIHSNDLLEKEKTLNEKLRFI